MRNFGKYLLVAGAALCVLALGGITHSSLGEGAAAASSAAAATSTPATPSDVAKLQVLLSTYGTSTTPFDAQAQTKHCQINGPLPDPACSPGAVYSAGPDKICVPGYAASVRNVSASTKKKVYIAYGLAYPQPTGTYELDHLVPLELGGNNTTANLFPEAASPAPGFHEKDLVEDYLHDEVCGGDISLSAAQHQIADDWTAVYALMSPETIYRLQHDHPSWAKN